MHAPDHEQDGGGGDREGQEIGGEDPVGGKTFVRWNEQDGAIQDSQTMPMRR